MADIDRTVSRRLRDFGAKAEIKCTSSLVQAYNDANDAEDCQALSLWIENYFKEVSQSSLESISSEHLHEFAALAKIRRTDATAADFVKRVFCCLRKCVKSGESCSLSVILALERVLAVVDAKILEPEATNLSTLVHDLMDKTDPEKHPLDRTTYVSQTAHLLTLEKTLIALHDMKEEKSGESTVDFFRQTIKQRLNSIIDKQKYFPVAYHAQLVKQNIKMLFLNNIRSFLSDIGRSGFLFLSGGLHVCQGLREIVELKFDLSVILSGIKEIGKAISDWRSPDIPDLYEISLAASEAAAKDDFGIFARFFENLGSWKREWKTSQKSLVIKYALIMHLCLFFTEESSETIQEHSMGLLQTLALDEGHARWRSEPELYGGLLDVITSIAVQCSRHDTTCMDTFNQMQQRADEVQTKAIDDFLGKQTFEEKVRSRQTPEIKEPRRSLFHIVRDRAGIHQTFSICVQNRQLLIKNYSEDTFAMVPLIMGLHQEKHVGNFDFNLVVYEQMLVRNDSGGLFDQGTYSQVANNVQRTLRVRKPISIRQIFDKRKKIADGPLEEIRIVLAIGSPGTGKTSLSKRLCYDWANEKWGTMFNHVYLLWVRQLGRGNRGSQKDLVEAIVNLCYKADQRQDSTDAIYDEVRDRLQEKTTLLILDGLDEGDHEAWELVYLSLKQPCYLLLLSRPHNVQRVREKADIEIECLGFNDKHLRRFIAKELQSDDAEDLLHFLIQSPSIWDAALVPVNAQIICNMWMSSVKEELKTMAMVNVAWLYGRMADYVWLRYTEKDNAKGQEKDSVFNSLEIIAFESIKKGKVEIPESLVTEHSKNTSSAILRDAGFLLLVQEGQVFQFAHLTFHEYFAGRHLANMLDSTKNKEKRKAIKFISEHKYADTSRVVFAFMIGLYCRDDDVEECLECFKTLIDVLDDDPVEPIGKQHTLLKMRSLETFLTCCPDTDYKRSTDEQINEIVSLATGIVKDWLVTKWSFGVYGGMSTIHKRLWDQMFDELANMPNLLREYPDLLEMILINEKIRSGSYHSTLGQAIRIARLNPQAVGKMVPSIDDETDAWRAWIRLCSWVGEECAAVALPTMIEAIRKEGQEKKTRIISPALDLLDVFPDNEEIKQIIHEASQHPDAKVRFHTLNAIGAHSFRPGSSAGTFAWSLHKLATNDSDVDVRRAAFTWLYTCNQTSPQSIDERIELATEAVNDPDPSINGTATNNVYYLLRAAPHKEGKLLPLLEKLCMHANSGIRTNAMNYVWDIHRASLLQTDKLLPLVSSVCQYGASDIRHDLLPLLSILEAESDSSLTHLTETIAKGSDNTDEEVKNRALACKEAGIALSSTTIAEIRSKFHDIEASTQMEILRQIHGRKLLTSETVDAAAEMALICIVDGNRNDRSKLDGLYKNAALDLLKDIAKESPLPGNVLKELAARGQRYVERIWRKETCGARDDESESATCIRKQPISHLLDHYFRSRNDQIVPVIAEKLLLTPVSFTETLQSEMKVTVIDGGNLAEQRVPLDAAQELLSLCKEYLKTDLHYTHVS